MKTKTLNRTRWKHTFLAAAVAAATAQLTALSALAEVNPPSVDVTVSPGSSIDVEKTITTPALPQALDLCLMLDLSSSYGDDLPNIRGVAPGLFDAISGDVPDAQFCVNSFVDFPLPNWGNVSTDYAYRLDQDLTGDKATWTGAIDALTVKNGGDIPESQYEALYQAATGAGNDIFPDGNSLGDVPPDQDPSWRSNSTRVIAMTTDAPFHNPGDGGGPTSYPYPGPSEADTIAALQAADIRVIAIKATGASDQMNRIASATGGSVVTTSNTSAEIADAILEGLGSLPITVTPVPLGCDPLSVSFTPSSSTVTSGETVAFLETIQVPADAPSGTQVNCRVDFRDDAGTSLGFQDIAIYIQDTAPPQASCIAGINPAGKEPRGGVQSPGQNEDGFYLLSASDGSGVAAAIFVTDLGSGTEFGPFTDGTTIKYTQAQGAKPSAKPGSGEVDWKIIGSGDFTVTAVDEQGNASDAGECLVPSPPQ